MRMKWLASAGVSAMLLGPSLNAQTSRPYAGTASDPPAYRYPVGSAIGTAQPERGARYTFYTTPNGTYIGRAPADSGTTAPAANESGPEDTSGYTGLFSPGFVPRNRTAGPSAESQARGWFNTSERHLPATQVNQTTAETNPVPGQVRNSGWPNDNEHFSSYSTERNHGYYGSYSTATRERIAQRAQDRNTRTSNHTGIRIVDRARTSRSNNKSESAGNNNTGSAGAAEQTGRTASNQEVNGGSNENRTSSGNNGRAENNSSR